MVYQNVPNENPQKIAEYLPPIPPYTPQFPAHSSPSGIGQQPQISYLATSLCVEGTGVQYLGPAVEC